METTWKWTQPVDRIWTIISDPENGIIKTINEKNELILEQKGLDAGAVIMIEENFLSLVAVKLQSAGDGYRSVGDRSNRYDLNPMYA